MPAGLADVFVVCSASLTSSAHVTFCNCLWFKSCWPLAGIARMQLALPKLQNWRDAKFSPGAKRPRLPRKPEKPAAPEQPAPKQQPVDPQAGAASTTHQLCHALPARRQDMASSWHAAVRP